MKMEEAKDEDCNLELETEEKTAHADQTEISDSVELPDCSDQHFTQALNILIHKPHAVHKRLAGSVILSGETDYARNFVLRRKLVLKKGSLHLFDTVIFKCGHNGTGSQCLEVSFVPEKHLPFMPSGFSVTKCGDKICFALDDAVPAPVRSKQNARKCFSTLIKWCSEETLSQSSPTLRLVSLEEYYKRYGLLKAKYGKSIIENWTESTDAEKFVHEDVAIATYLSLLWDEEARLKNGKKPTFLDLGCGNGLLVHILTGEGYSGTGLDIRKRKIWDTFPTTVDLRVETIHPSADLKYPGYDWLVGNHSDELTPWLPVIAANTSENVNFFVLPCCPFEFYAKFKRKNTNQSVYQEYLGYVKEVGETCGFIMEEDKLRIPSTKRVCFVGRKRNYSPSERENVLSKVCRLVSVQRPEEEEGPTEHKKPKFEPRPADIVVRNCTQLDRSLIKDIIDVVVKKCLETENLLPDSSLRWNMGGKVLLRDLASLLTAGQLSQLKSSCGGLQTLLRNHKYIFVVEGGAARLRCHAFDNKRTGKKSQAKAVDKFRKSKRCWFFDNHPQGCPVPQEDCKWAHGESDLAI